MPVTNFLTDAGIGVVTRCSGVLTADEFIAAVRTRYEPEEALGRLRYIVTDHTAVERFDMDTDDIVELTRITTAASQRNPNIYLASVVPANLAFGIVRMWQGYAEERLAWEMRMCRSRSEAEDWLRKRVDGSLTFR